MTVGSGLSLNPGEQDIGKIVQAIRQLIEGRSNACGVFTITAGATTTTVNSVTAGPNSVILWTPLTASAAAQTDKMYATSHFPGGFIVAHASNPSTDQTFAYVAIG